MNPNPLKQYFRQPAIYIRLPSQGNFYGEGALAATANGEYPVLPMTTMDEITYRTPDALFNGQAVVSVIQSCVPNILDAWHMPILDLDTVLIAIRIATYGHEMDINTTCPACSTEADFGLDLRAVLEQIQPGDFGQPFRMGDLEIFIGPVTYQQINQNSIAQFEDQKLLRALDDAALTPEQKMQHISDALKNITTMTIRTLAQHIRLIKTPQAMVTELEHIIEWLTNANRADYARIRDFVIGNKERSEVKPLPVTCPNCSHQYQQTFTLDMSNFFADAS